MRVNQIFSIGSRRDDLLEVVKAVKLLPLGIQKHDLAVLEGERKSFEGSSRGSPVPRVLVDQTKANEEADREKRDKNVHDESPNGSEKTDTRYEAALLFLLLL